MPTEEWSYILLVDWLLDPAIGHFLSCYLTHSRGRINGFIHFPRVYACNWMQLSQLEFELRSPNSHFEALSITPTLHPTLQYLVFSKIDWSRIKHAVGLGVIYLITTGLGLSYHISIVIRLIPSNTGRVTASLFHIYRVTASLSHNLKASLSNFYRDTYSPS